MLALNCLLMLFASHAAEAKLQARIFTKDLTDEEIDALAAVAVAGQQDAQPQQATKCSRADWSGWQYRVITG